MTDPKSDTRTDASPAPRRVFALADTHLPGGMGKTMDKFGSFWQKHAEKIAANAARVVGPGDIFLLPGDLSWAKKRRNAAEDLAFLAALPGIKICVKGNHDFWWESDTPIGYPGLLSPPVVLEDGLLGIAGSRGWDHPANGRLSRAADTKIFEREQKRLEKSLEGIAHCQVKIAMLHYPPQPFLPLLQAAGVEAVVYGHIHKDSLPRDEVLALDGVEVEGVRLYCVPCDRIDFTPREIPLSLPL